MESQYVQQGKWKTYIQLTQHGVCPTVQWIFLLQVQFANHQIDEDAQIRNKYTCLCRAHSVIEEAEEQGHTAQYADVAIHLNPLVLVHQATEFRGGHSTDDAE
jgi:hypothetical protein